MRCRAEPFCPPPPMRQRRITHTRSGVGEWGGKPFGEGQNPGASSGDHFLNPPLWVPTGPPFGGRFAAKARALWTGSASDGGQSPFGVLDRWGHYVSPCPPGNSLPGTGEGFMNRAPPRHLSVNRGGEEPPPRGGTAEGRERRDKWSLLACGAQHALRLPFPPGGGGFSHFVGLTPLWGQPFGAPSGAEKCPLYESLLIPPPIYAGGDEPSAGRHWLPTSYLKRGVSSVLPTPEGEGVDERAASAPQSNPLCGFPPPRRVYPSMGEPPRG
jgi:hypothetical protein